MDNQNTSGWYFQPGVYGVLILVLMDNQNTEQEPWEYSFSKQS